MFSMFISDALIYIADTWSLPDTLRVTHTFTKNERFFYLQIRQLLNVLSYCYVLTFTCI